MALVLLNKNVGQIGHCIIFKERGRVRPNPVRANENYNRSPPKDSNRGGASRRKMLHLASVSINLPRSIVCVLIQNLQRGSKAKVLGSTCEIIVLNCSIIIFLISFHFPVIDYCEVHHTVNIKAIIYFISG